MQIVQKAGFSISASIFVVLGLVFLIAGFLADSSVLKTMGLVWLPLSIINFLIIFWIFRNNNVHPAE